MRSSLLLALLLSTPVPGPAQGGERLPPVRGRDAELILTSSVSVTRLREQVHALCRLGPRQPGTASGQAASAWVATALESHGLEPEQRRGGKVWGYEKGEHSFRLLGKEGAIPLPSAWPVLHSPPLAGGVLRVVPSERVKEGRDLEGCAILVLREASAGAGTAEAGDVRRWKERGARAVVMGHVPSEQWHPEGAPLWETDPNGGQGLPLPVISLGSADTGTVLAEVAGGQEVRLEARLKGSTVTGRGQTVLARLGPRTGAGAILVVASLEGLHGSPGAGDNASGVSVALEIARVLAVSIKAGDVSPLARPVVFVFPDSRRSTDLRTILLDVAPQGDAGGVLSMERAAAGQRGDALYLACAGALEADLEKRARLRGALADYQGRKGFWTRWEWGAADPLAWPGLPESTPLVVLSSVPSRGASGGVAAGGGDNEVAAHPPDCCPALGTSADTPSRSTDPEPWNLEHCARAGLVLVSRLGLEEGR